MPRLAACLYTPKSPSKACSVHAARWLRSTQSCEQHTAAALASNMLVWSVQPCRHCLDADALDSACTCDLPCRGVHGVRRAGVFLLGEKADVVLDPRRASLDAVLAAVENAGFSAQLLSSTGAQLYCVWLRVQLQEPERVPHAGFGAHLPLPRQLPFRASTRLRILLRPATCLPPSACPPVMRWWK